MKDIINQMFYIKNKNNAYKYKNYRDMYFVKYYILSLINSLINFIISKKKNCRILKLLKLI